MSTPRFPIGFTAEAIRELLAYDPISGVFTWRAKQSKRTVVGARAEYPKEGYLAITIGGKCALAHRLAWLYMTGIPPNADIDHINGTRSDNRFSNLRDVSRSVNTQNRLVPNPKNTTRLIGVSRDRERFCARINIDGRQVRIGTFWSAEEANKAYLHEKAIQHPDARKPEQPIGPIPSRIASGARMKDASPEILSLRSKGLSQAAIGRLVGISQPAVCLVLAKLEGAR
jgi:hypothetical protein